MLLRINAGNYTARRSVVCPVRVRNRRRAGRAGHEIWRLLMTLSRRACKITCAEVLHRDRGRNANFVRGCTAHDQGYQGQSPWLVTYTIVQAHFSSLVTPFNDAYISPRGFDVITSPLALILSIGSTNVKWIVVSGVKSTKGLSINKLDNLRSAK
jgi:hypothetical protein